MQVVSIRVNKLLIGSLLLVILGTCFFGYAQKNSRSKLDRERKEIKKKIREANKLLSATQTQKKASESQLRALNQRIYTQEKYLKNLQSEVQLINHEMEDMEDIIYALQRDVDSLKNEYSNMVYTTYKANNAFSQLSYFFASESYNQLTMRIKYLEQFRNARKAQVTKISQLKAYLVEREVKLQGKLNEKNETLKSLEGQRQELAQLQTKQKSMVSELSSREGEFRNKIKKYQREQEKLDKLIRDMIIAETKKSKPSNNSSSKLVNRKEVALISKTFAANKGRLPWPITRCFIARRFGKRPHPVLENIYVMNNGLGLQCTKGSEVKAVFDGEVTTVATIPGMNKIVMVKHGEFFTVYAKLESVYVSTGDKISAKKVIGQVQTTNGNETELEFQIWKNKEKLDPEKWLAR